MKGNERILARVQEIVGLEVSLERVLRELAAIAFSDIAVSLVPSDRLCRGGASSLPRPGVLSACVATPTSSALPKGRANRCTVLGLTSNLAASSASSGPR
jgi:hypothetical protein